MQRTGIRWTVLGALAIAAAGGIALLFAPRPVEVDIAPVAVGPIAETVQDQGVTRVRDAYVVSAPVAGTLQRIDLDVGDHVTAGASLIARLRPTPPAMLDPRIDAQTRARVNAAEAAVGAARAVRDRLAAEARRADLAYRRIAPLVEVGATSQQARDDAEAAARSSKAAVAEAESDLAARRAEAVAARAALLGPEAASSQTVSVYAPATGHVTRILQESERVVGVGAPLVEISETGGLEAQIEFLSQDAVRIREGMAAEIYDWGGEHPIPALVRRVEPEGFVKISALGVEERRVLVMLQFTGPADQWARMGRGYGVWGRVFLRKEPKALKVPLGALVGSGQGWAAYRLRAGRAVLTPLRIGAMTDREAEVQAGLAPADKVILFPSDKVRDGVLVRPRP